MSSGMHPDRRCGSIPKIPMSSISPDQVRQLRGTESRAAFARRLGVTPNTIYRWELPEGSAEARRPRGAELSKLERLQDGALPMSASGERRADAPQQASDDLAQALLGVERVLNGEARRAQSELVQLLATQRGLSANALALAGFGIALAEVVLTGDSRSAMVAISSALSDAEQGILQPAFTAAAFDANVCPAHVPR